MNENLNLVEILKDCPKRTSLEIYQINDSGNGLFYANLTSLTGMIKGHCGHVNVTVALYGILMDIHFVVVVQKVVGVQRMDIVRQDYTLYGLALKTELLAKTDREQKIISVEA